MPLPAGAITTVPGSGYGVAVDAAGNVFIAAPNRVQRVDPATGVITTVAGAGAPGHGGDGGPAAAAALDYPSGVALDAAG